MEETKVVDPSDGIRSFIDDSPNPYAVTSRLEHDLLERGYKKLREVEDKWAYEIKPNGKYFMTRGHTLLVAFEVGGKWDPYCTQTGGFSIIASHTDSPHLKIKPHPTISKNGIMLFNVECYGGAQWTSWLDRDLELGGAVVHKSSGTNDLKTSIIRLPHVFRIPSLAAHLGGPRDKADINKQNHLVPFMGFEEAEKKSKEQSEGKELEYYVASQMGIDVGDIVGLDLRFADRQPCATGGLKNEFLYARHLDNLFNVYCSMESLWAAEGLENDCNIRMNVCFDNEEIGSVTNVGAHSTFLIDLLKRIIAASGVSSGGDAEASTLRKSFIISADMVHSAHPLFGDKHDPTQTPIVKMTGGVTIKHSAARKYASDLFSISTLKHIANLRNLPIQESVSKNDQRTGSTVGPHLNTMTGLSVVDCGSPMLSMHSVREMCAVDDIVHCTDLFRAFFEERGAMAGQNALID